MFEKIIKFGCGFIVIFFVVMICIAMCSAYFATNEASSTCLLYTSDAADEL